MVDTVLHVWPFAACFNLTGSGRIELVEREKQQPLVQQTVITCMEVHTYASMHIHEIYVMTIGSGRDWCGHTAPSPRGLRRCQTLKKNVDEEDAVTSLVVGTESRFVNILDPSGRCRPQPNRLRRAASFDPIPILVVAIVGVSAPTPAYVARVTMCACARSFVDCVRMLWEFAAPSSQKYSCLQCR